MMKFTIETDSQDDALMMLHSPDAFAALREIYNTTRNHLKHGSDDSNRLILEQVRNLANAAMEIVE